ncbi:MAG: hypothetical protein KGD63_11950 [Candidatus Lokiarchaeota archaeon]|nr:hypothetical protein [Candidatus Lokiarchaeota archaeon]
MNSLTKFIDFDKSARIFYDNLYLNDEKLVVKVPLYFKEMNKNRVKIDVFDLTKYTYLISYD